jgi:hypothetical protein
LREWREDGGPLRLHGASSTSRRSCQHLKGGGFFVLRAGSPAGSVDHVSIRLDRFDKEDVTRRLKELGISPIDETAGAGFHIVDPDGFRVQIQ